MNDYDRFAAALVVAANKREWCSEFMDEVRFLNRSLQNGTIVVASTGPQTTEYNVTLSVTFAYTVDEDDDNCTYTVMDEDAYAESLASDVYVSPHGALRQLVKLVNEGMIYDTDVIQSVVITDQDVAIRFPDWDDTSGA